MDTFKDLWVIDDWSSANANYEYEYQSIEHNFEKFEFKIYVQNPNLFYSDSPEKMNSPFIIYVEPGERFPPCVRAVFALSYRNLHGSKNFMKYLRTASILNLSKESFPKDQNGFEITTAIPNSYFMNSGENIAEAFSLYFCFSWNRDLESLSSINTNSDKSLFRSLQQQPSFHTCYLNSALTLLFHLSSFRELICNLPLTDSDSKSPSNKFLYYFIQQFKVMKVNKICHNINNIVKALGWNDIALTIPQDGQEFFSKLLSRIEKSLETLSPESCKVFKNMFYSQFIQKEVPPTMMISVEDSEGTFPNIIVALRHHFLQETSSGQKEGILMKLPKILIFDTHDNRFMKYPMFLNMGEFLNDKAKEESNEENQDQQILENPFYSLYGIMIFDQKNEHYFSYVRNKATDDFCKIDRQVKTLLSSKQNQKIDTIVNPNLKKHSLNDLTLLVSHVPNAAFHKKQQTLKKTKKTYNEIPRMLIYVNELYLSKFCKNDFSENHTNSTQNNQESLSKCIRLFNTSSIVNNNFLNNDYRLEPFKTICVEDNEYKRLFINEESTTNKYIFWNMNFIGESCSINQPILSLNNLPYNIFLQECEEIPESANFHRFFCFLNFDLEKYKQKENPYNHILNFSVPKYNYTTTFLSDLKNAIQNQNKSFQVEKDDLYFGLNLSTKTFEEISLTHPVTYINPQIFIIFHQKKNDKEQFDASLFDSYNFQTIEPHIECHSYYKLKQQTPYSLDQILLMKYKSINFVIGLFGYRSREKYFIKIPYQKQYIEFKQILLEFLKTQNNLDPDLDLQNAKPDNLFIFPSPFWCSPLSKPIEYTYKEINPSNSLQILTLEHIFKEKREFNCNFVEVYVYVSENPKISNLIRISFSPDAITPNWFTEIILDKNKTYEEIWTEHISKHFPKIQIKNLRILGIKLNYISRILKAEECMDSFDEIRFEIIPDNQINVDECSLYKFNYAVYASIKYVLPFGNPFLILYDENQSISENLKGSLVIKNMNYETRIMKTSLEISPNDTLSTNISEQSQKNITAKDSIAIIINDRNIRRRLKQYSSLAYKQIFTNLNILN